MDDEILINLNLPVLSYSINIKYSHVEKPTGLSYIILTSIESFSESGLTWREVLNILGIPEDMFELFREELTVMESNQMVKFRSMPSIKTKVSSVLMTEFGKKVFDKGETATQTKETFANVLYFAASDHYGFMSNGFRIYPGFDNKFSDIVEEWDDVDQFINENKDRIGIEPSEDIISIDHLKTIKASVPEKVFLNFDESKGWFNLLNSKYVDSYFIKHYYKTTDLIDEMDPSIFSLPDNMKGEFKKTNLCVESSWTLPKSMVNLKGRYFIFNRGSSEFENGFGLDSLPFDSDFVSITSKSIGHCYRLAIHDVGIEGMDGVRSLPLIERKMLNPAEIHDIMISLAHEKFDTTVDGLMQALEIVDVVDDEDESLNFISEYVEFTNDVISVLELASKYQKSKWSRNIGSILISILKRSSSTSRIRLCKSVASLPKKQVINGGLAGIELFSGNTDENLSIADALYPICTPGTTNKMLAALKVGPVISKMILEGKHIMGDSSLFKNADYASASLSEMRKTLHVDRIKEYFFSYDWLSNDDKFKISKNAADLKKVVGLLNEEIPCVELNEVMEYATFFEDLKEVIQIPDNGDYREMKGRSFGIYMRIHLEQVFDCFRKNEDDTLATLIARARNTYNIDGTPLISKNQKNMLDDMRNFGNQCAHEKTIESISEETRFKWIKALERLEEQVSRYMNRGN